MRLVDAGFHGRALRGPGPWLGWLPRNPKRKSSINTIVGTSWFVDVKDPDVAPLLSEMLDSGAQFLLFLGPHTGQSPFPFDMQLVDDNVARIFLKSVLLLAGMGFKTARLLVEMLDASVASEDIRGGIVDEDEERDHRVVTKAPRCPASACKLKSWDRHVSFSRETALVALDALEEEGHLGEGLEGLATRLGEALRWALDSKGHVCFHDDSPMAKAFRKLASEGSRAAQMVLAQRTDR